MGGDKGRCVKKVFFVRGVCFGGGVRAEKKKGKGLEKTPTWRL